MLKFLFMIFFFGFILISLLGFSVFRSFRSFFSGDTKDRNRKRTNSAQQPRNGTQNKTTPQNPPPRKKVFTEDEGEYVDYEEIKD